MKEKVKNKIKVDLWVLPIRTHGRLFSGVWQRFVVILVIMAMVMTWSFFPVKPARAVGIDAVTASVPEGSDGTGVEAAITVTFEKSVLTDGEVFTIYVGEDTTGDEWNLNSADNTTCTDDGTGETYTFNSISAATATLPMRTQITATTVGTGGTTATCVIGDGAPSNPMNPGVADGYSVAVVTNADSGAGVIYIGDANDIAVSVTVLPNLTLTISTPDGTFCTTTSGVTSCNLGTVLTTTVASGFYDVDVGTNAGSGATVWVTEDTDLNNALPADIDDVSDNTVTAGTEEYGLDIAETGDAWTIDGFFLNIDAPVEPPANEVATSTGPVDASTNNIDVIHEVAVASNTLALVYDHIVTWTATANF